MYYDPKECGNRIRKQIKVCGYTQEQFANKLNIAVQHLRNILAGTRGASIDLIVEIAAILDVSIDYLLTGYEHHSVDSKNRILEVVKELSSIAQSL